MKKIRVLKELPFGKVGTVIEQSCRDGDYKFVSKRFAQYFTDFEVDNMIEDGWLEYVEEKKSLEGILHELLYQYIGLSGCLALEHRITDYFKKRFDKAIGGISIGNFFDLTQLRTALFGDDK